MEWSLRDKLITYLSSTDPEMVELGITIICSEKRLMSDLWSIRRELFILSGSIQARYVWSKIMRCGE